MPINVFNAKYAVGLVFGFLLNNSYGNCQPPPLPDPCVFPIVCTAPGATVAAMADQRATSLYLTREVLEEVEEQHQLQEEGLLDQRLSGFITGSFYREKKERTSTLGYDLDTIGLLAGVDYRITNEFFLGGFINSSKEETGYSDCLGFQDVDELGFGLISIYQLASWASFDIVVNYSDRDYSLQNNLHIRGPFYVTTNGDASGDRTIVSTGLNFELPMFMQGIGILRTSLEYLRKTRDGYIARSDAGGRIVWDDDEIKSLISTLQIQFAKNFSTSFGVVSPELWAAWNHQFDNDSRIIRATVTETGGDWDNYEPNIVIVTEEPDRDYFDLSAGVVLTLPHGIAAFASYTHEFGRDNYKLWSFALGARIEF